MEDRNTNPLRIMERIIRQYSVDLTKRAYSKQPTKSVDIRSSGDRRSQSVEPCVDLSSGPIQPRVELGNAISNSALEFRAQKCRITLSQTSRWTMAKFKTPLGSPTPTGATVH